VEDTTNQAIDEQTQGFLDAEEMARKLADKLSKLDEATSRHESAANSLSENAEATRDLVVSVRDLGVKAAEALEVVASVGGPGVIEHIRSLESDLGSRLDLLKGRVHLAIGLAGIAAALALAAMIMVLPK